MGRTRGLLLLLHVLGRQLGLLGVGRGHLHGHGLLARHEAGGLRVWHLAGRALHAGLGGLGRTLHLHLLLLLNLLLLLHVLLLLGHRDGPATTSSSSSTRRQVRRLENLPNVLNPLPVIQVLPAQDLGDVGLQVRPPLNQRYELVHVHLVGRLGLTRPPRTRHRRTFHPTGPAAPTTHHPRLLRGVLHVSRQGHGRGLDHPTRVPTSAPALLHGHAPTPSTRQGGRGPALGATQPTGDRLVAAGHRASAAHHLHAPHASHAPTALPGIALDAATASAPRLHPMHASPTPQPKGAAGAKRTQARGRRQARVEMGDVDQGGRRRGRRPVRHPACAKDWPLRDDGSSRCRRTRLSRLAGQAPRHRREELLLLQLELGSLRGRLLHRLQSVQGRDRLVERHVLRRDGRGGAGGQLPVGQRGALPQPVLDLAELHKTFAEAGGGVVVGPRQGHRGHGRRLGPRHGRRLTGRLEEEVQTEGTVQKSALREAFPNALETTVSNGENMIQEHCEKALATLMRKNEEAIKNAMWLMVSKRLAYFDEVTVAKLQAELPFLPGVVEAEVNREGTLLKVELRQAFPYAPEVALLNGKLDIDRRIAKALSTLKSKNEVYLREDEAFKRVRGHQYHVICCH